MVKTDEGRVPGWKTMANIPFYRIARHVWVLIFLSVVAGCVTPPRSVPLPSKNLLPPLPREKFWWGVATSSYQNEDRGMNKDAKDFFLTDWDIFSSEGLAPERGEDATFSWTHFDKDLALLKKLGVSHYRFSVEWARVEPHPGQINKHALAQYTEMARQLRAAGIEPIVTLWHFTFPGWAYDPKQKGRSNFLHPDIEPAWQAHVTRTVRALAPHVKIWVPQNEPNGALPIGYLGAHWPPGLLLRPDLYKRAMKISVRMFRDAAAIVRQEKPGAIIMGIYSNPAWRQSWLGDPTFLTFHTLRRTNFDHLDQTYDVCDLLGFNYYYAQDASLINFLRKSKGEFNSNHTQLGWEIEPEGMYQGLREMYSRYQKPIVVTENGLGTLSEQKKIRYLRDHITQTRRAMAAGVDVRGYFAWTLVDNYEWQKGWTANFGLSHMDPRTKNRILEPSGVWYREFIKRHPEP